MARSYIRIYGPPLAKALKALEQVAVDMSKKTEMRYFSISVPAMIIPQVAVGEPMPIATGDVSEERVKLISTATHMLGDSDFFFEWSGDPTWDQVVELIEQIDDALAKLGCNYTITTR